MAKPMLLMLDEPSLGLAPLIVPEIFHVIADLKKTGVAILLVEPNTRGDAADRRLRLRAGNRRNRPARAGALRLADDPKVIESYLGLGRKA